jgi:hypothetical protein
VLVTDAARSLACAIDDGKTRLEIEFPWASILYSLRFGPVRIACTFSFSPPVSFAVFTALLRGVSLRSWWIATDHVQASAEQHLFLQGYCTYPPHCAHPASSLLTSIDTSCCRIINFLYSWLTITDCIESDIHETGAGRDATYVGVYCNVEVCTSVFFPFWGRQLLICY